MTKAVVTKNNDEHTLYIRGHAGFNPGNDIVCAAVSALAYTLLQCMEAEKTKLREYHRYINAERGEFRIRVKANPEDINEVLTMFNVISSGLMLISGKYPDNVRFEYKDIA